MTKCDRVMILWVVGLALLYLPVSSSYMKMPSDQRSAAKSWPLFRMISGETYSGVPQKVHVFRPWPILLAKPKSTYIIICGSITYSSQTTTLTWYNGSGSNSRSSSSSRNSRSSNRCSSSVRGRSIHVVEWPFELFLCLNYQFSISCAVNEYVFRL